MALDVSVYATRKIDKQHIPQEECHSSHAWILPSMARAQDPAIYFILVVTMVLLNLFDNMNAS